MGWGLGALLLCLSLDQSFCIGYQIQAQGGKVLGKQQLYPNSVGASAILFLNQSRHLPCQATDGSAGLDMTEQTKEEKDTPFTDDVTTKYRNYPYSLQQNGRRYVARNGLIPNEITELDDNKLF